jgi:DNA-binding IclR family transcriptional regulator
MVDGATELKALFQPMPGGLARAAGETIQPASLKGAHIVYLDNFNSPPPVAGNSVSADGQPPTAWLRARPSWLRCDWTESPRRRAWAPTRHAQRVNSLTRLNALGTEGARTQVRGWAQNREKWRLGVYGRETPVLNALGEPVAAVTMSVPSIRFTRSRANELAAKLCECAQGSSAAPGFAAQPQAPELTHRKR